MTAQSPTHSATPPTLLDRRRLLTFFLDHLVWFILLVVLIGFSLTIDRFFQIGIFINILRQATFVGILAVGLSLVIIAGHLDLSIESVMAFGAMLTAFFIASGGAGLGIDINPWLTLPAALAFGALIGLGNGFLVAHLQISAFIVTLAGFIGIRGAGLMLTGGRSVYGLPDSLRAIAGATIFGLPLLVFLLIATYVVFHVVLTRTTFGRHIYLVGGNPTAPFRAGIPVKRLLIQVFILSGLLAAFAGWLLAARTNGATPNLGFGHAVRGVCCRRHRRRQSAGRRRPAERRVRRRAAAQLHRHGDQRHGPAAAVHAGDPRPAGAGRGAARLAQDHDPQPLPVSVRSPSDGESSCTSLSAERPLGRLAPTQAGVVQR